MTTHLGALPALCSVLGIPTGMMLLPPLPGAMLGSITGGAIGILALHITLKPTVGEGRR